MTKDMASTLAIAGRLLVAFYYLWSAWFNVMNWQRNVDELAKAGVVRFGSSLVGLGTMEMTLASLLFIYAPTAIWGGIGIILFTLGADVLYHRWWTFEDPGDRVLHKQMVMEHVALNGGILGLMAASTIS